MCLRNRTRCLTSLEVPLASWKGLRRRPRRDRRSCRGGSSRVIGWKQRQSIHWSLGRICKMFVFCRCPIVFHAKRLSARRYVEFVKSATPAHELNGIRKVKADATRPCRNTMAIKRSGGRTYRRISDSIRNVFSAGVVVGASGSLKSWSGMPSSSVATANSSRSLRFRDAVIDLRVVNTDYRTSKRSEKRALSIKTDRTLIPPALIAEASGGRRARAQS